MVHQYLGGVYVVYAEIVGAGLVLGGCLVADPVQLFYVTLTWYNLDGLWEAHFISTEDQTRSEVGLCLVYCGAKPDHRSPDYRD